MKKIFKGLSILVASTALCGGIAMATACDGGYNGTYTGEYHYESWGQYYGMVVEVTVENNVITKVKDVTNTENATKNYQSNNEWHVCSPGWEDKWIADTNAAHAEDASKPDAKTQIDAYKNEHAEAAWLSDAEIANLISGGAPSWYKWTNAQASEWATYEAWVLQKYEGIPVSDILDMQVFIKNNGEPYDSDKNVDLTSNGLLVTGATQSSSRLLLAVQNALGKTTEIGRIG